MFCDLLLGECFRVDDGYVGFYDLEGLGDVYQGDAGYDLVGGAEEEAGNLLCVCGVGGFSDDSAVEVDDGVGGEDESVGIFSGDVICLGECELLCMLDGICAFGVEGGFIDVRADDIESVACTFEQQLSPRRGGGEDERVWIGCVGHGLGLIETG